jgi:formamidopyrimidine-DNA glycosylase
MKSSCEGAKEVMQDGVPCEDCGEPMDYKDLDSYGRPKYFCQDCGITVTL